MGNKRVCVVGAGASGLPSIRHALLHNLDVVCFEGSDNVGGLWNYKPEETDLSSVMKSTVINTCKEMTAYSDFPPEDTMANFMHNTEMYRYLKNYAQNFRLIDHIKFNHKVVSIERSKDYKKDGTWDVTYSHNGGAAKKETFDAVMLCSGHHSIPHVPEPWPGQEKFQGRIIHSHSYKDHRGYEDKIVVVVGIGNSGGDVAVELSRIAKQVYLVTRRGSWVFNRIFDQGLPVDLAYNSAVQRDLMKVLPISLTCSMIEKKLNQRFDHEKYGLKPKHSVFQAHPTVNDELPNRIACGTVRVKPGIREFTKNGIVFEDGSVVEGVDEVVLATGFSFEFNLVENGKLIPVKDNSVQVYKYIFPLETADFNTLGVIGLVQPVGSIMPLSEMQARVFLGNLVGETKLPDLSKMRSDIIYKREEMKHRYVASRRHTIQVDYTTYIEELATLVGCQVDYLKLLLTDPVLFYQSYFGPLVPYVYRLHGPHSWSGARKAIMSVDYRVTKATNSKAQPNEKTSFPTLLLLALFLLPIFFCLLCYLF